MSSVETVVRSIGIIAALVLASHRALAMP